MFTFVRCPAAELAAAARAASVEASIGPTDERGWTTVLPTRREDSTTWLESWPRLELDFMPLEPLGPQTIRTPWRLAIRVPPLELRSPRCKTS